MPPSDAGSSGSRWGSLESGDAGESVKTRVAIEPTSAGGLAGGVETGLMVLPGEEMQWRLLLYIRSLGSDQCLFGYLSWSAPVSQTNARTKTDCRRLRRAA